MTIPNILELILNISKNRLLKYYGDAVSTVSYQNVMV